MSITNSRLSPQEQETHLYYDPHDPLGGKWIAETSVKKHMTKLKKQGWLIVDETHFESPNGPVVSMRFVSNENAVSFRNHNSLKCPMSAAQRAAAAAASERIKTMWKNKKSTT